MSVQHTVTLSRHLALVDENFALVKALRALVDEAAVYVEDKTTPDCWQDSGPYCGTHSFLETSPLIEQARALLAKVTA